MSTRNRLAQTPPMGWNSFTCFGISVTEAEVKANAKYMAERLKQHGWEYVVVDGMWYEDFGADGTVTDPKLREPMHVDECGRLLPAVKRFPSSAGGRGLKPIADYVHGLGLKFGLHINRGIARVAVEQNTPVFGTPYRADDIADKNNLCTWYNPPYMYGVDMTKPGAQAYYDSLVAQYAAWDVDFIKADDIGYPYQKAEIEGLSQAIESCGRPMALSLSIGHEQDTSFAEHRKANSELWRIGGDLHDKWEQIRGYFDAFQRWAPHAGPGHWPDGDMLPLGKIHIRLFSNPHMTKLTRDEQMTLMTLWCIARSPLMFAGDLPGNDDWTLSLLTNDEALATNQKATNSRELFRRGTDIVWASDVPDSSGKYVAVFNLADEKPTTVTVPFSELGLRSRCVVRDLWAKRDLGPFEEVCSAAVAPHGAGLYRIGSA